MISVMQGETALCAASRNHAVNGLRQRQG